MIDMKLDQDHNLREGVQDLLTYCGQTHKGTKKTPERFVNALRELLSGYDVDPKRILTTTFDDTNDLVCLTDIPFFSLCEHHLLPIQGVVHIAYLPHDRVVGLSKLPRLVQALSRRLIIQERFTSQIAEILMKTLRPKGVYVIVEAEHMCMQMRGVRSEGKMKTSALRGIFMNEAPRMEALKIMFH